MALASATLTYEAVAAASPVTAATTVTYAAVAAPVTAAATITYQATANTAPVAGADQVVEPYEVVTLTATDAQSVPSWSQVGGPAVTLLGSGAVLTFTAPATRAGTVLTFRAADVEGLTDDATVTVLPHNEWAVIGGVEVPMRTLAVTGGVAA